MSPSAGRTSNKCETIQRRGLNRPVSSHLPRTLTVRFFGKGPEPRTTEPTACAGQTAKGRPRRTALVYLSRRRLGGAEIVKPD